MKRLIAILVVLACLPPAAWSAGSPARGRILFLRCASCHDVSPAPSAKIGPNLYGVVGRRVGSQEGYAYSPALSGLNFVWDAARLDAWLADPNAVAPGTKMAFAGIGDADERRAIINYLVAQSGGAPP